ncbi:DUF2690 domain-containing protein [Sphaerisporangium sp. TRM90804]|uniref:DUF2690 domain-containing protein n=1 Tax=Sphaerisporangium sp. TRM90804 TaxID=3031113 RepID=UPI00244D3301|nr:DUF2690 domain-containing protein [Sphaerisporangium sp. TRM90804]MDH2426082.1 DUF2690 domain-containing protein [Sphaerisporangium sp. TRM90804]
MRGRTLGTAAAAAALGMLALASPASAGPDPEFQGAQVAAACSGSACDGKNPSTYCGGDARTVQSLRLGGQALLELRYSPSCRAAWARISNASYDIYNSPSPLARVVRNSDGRRYTCYVPQGGTSCYTAMVNDANVTSYAYGEWDSGVTTYTGRTGSYR